MGFADPCRGSRRRKSERSSDGPAPGKAPPKTKKPPRGTNIVERRKKLIKKSSSISSPLKKRLEYSAAEAGAALFESMDEGVARPKNEVIKIFTLEGRSITCSIIGRPLTNISPYYRLFCGCDDGDILELSLVSPGECTLTATFQGHTKNIRDLCVMSDFLVSASLDGTVRLWNLKTRTCIASHANHLAWVGSVCEWKPNQVVSGGFDSDTRLWDIHNPSSTSILCEMSDGIQSMKAIPSLHILLVGLYSGEILGWSSKFSRTVWKMKGHTDFITSIKYDQGESPQIFTASNDHTIRKWSIPQSYASSSALSKSFSRQVQLLSTATCFRGHRAGVLSLAIGASRFWSGSVDGTIIQWDKKSHNPKAVYGLNFMMGSINSLHMYHSLLITVSSDGIVREWKPSQKCEFCVDSSACEKFDSCSFNRKEPCSKCGQLVVFDKKDVHDKEECQERRIACPFGQYGCTLATTPKDLANHKKECDYRIRACRFAHRGCPETLPFRHLPDHEADCQYRSVSCPFKSCTNRVLKKYLAEHMLACTERPVACPNCRETVPASLLEGHLSSTCKNTSFRCSYADHGCTKQFSVSQQVARECHEKDCGYALADCPLCWMKLPRLQLPMHMTNECERRPTTTEMETPQVAKTSKTAADQRVQRVGGGYVINELPN